MGTWWGTGSEEWLGQTHSYYSLWGPLLDQRRKRQMKEGEGTRGNLFQIIGFLGHG